MTDEQILDVLKKGKKETRINIVYPVLVALIITVVLSVYTYIGKIRVNETAITLLEESRITYKDFNKFINAQNEINVLQEERQSILRGDLDAAIIITEAIQVRINELDKQIAIIKAKNEKRLEKYGMNTRGGSKVKVGLDWFLRDIEKTDET